MFADVILPLPVAGCFTYSLPVSFEEKVQVGCRIIVPFGSKKFYSAIVIRIHNQKPDCAIKEALELLDECPFLLPSQLKLWKWIADYYICPLGDVYKGVVVKMKAQMQSPSPLAIQGGMERERGNLSPAQTQAYTSILSSFE